MGAVDVKFIEAGATLDRIGNGQAFRSRVKLTERNGNLLLSIAVGSYCPLAMSPAELAELATPEERKYYPGVLRFGNCWIRLEHDSQDLGPPHAFLTGSRAYGEPSGESDIDLILPFDQLPRESREALERCSDPDPDRDPSYQSHYRFGRLSIVLAGEYQYPIWRAGTEVLCGLQGGRYMAPGAADGKFPISREFACGFLEQLAERKGVHWGGK